MGVVGCGATFSNCPSARSSLVAALTDYSGRRASGAGADLLLLLLFALLGLKEVLSVILRWTPRVSAIGQRPCPKAVARRRLRSCKAVRRRALAPASPGGGTQQLLRRLAPSERLRRLSKRHGAEAKAKLRALGRLYCISCCATQRRSLARPPHRDGPLA